MTNASTGLTVAFALLALIVASAWPLGVQAAFLGTGASRSKARRAALYTGAAMAGWLLGTAGLAAAGALDFGGRPPSMLVLLAAMIVLVFVIAGSRLGERLALGLPLALLVGSQGFRLPLELLMHRAFVEGLMPVQMSYSGLNFDILTGISAIVIGLLIWRGRVPDFVAWIWNVAGLALLLNVVVIALLSAPLPFRVFTNEPANVWVTQAPFVWLPAVFVATALLGHLLVLRRMRAGARYIDRSGSRGTESDATRQVAGGSTPR